MRVACVFALLMAAACGGSHFTIDEQLCDGGTATFTVDGTGNTLTLQQPCGIASQDGGITGTPADVTILQSMCVVAEDGGAPIAAFTLPGSFDPTKGDTFLATWCAPSCGDGGPLCEEGHPFFPNGPAMGTNGAVVTGGELVLFGCEDTEVPKCPGTQAFLQLIEH